MGDVLCPWGRDPASQDDAGLAVVGVSGIARADWLSKAVMTVETHFHLPRLRFIIMFSL